MSDHDAAPDPIDRAYVQAEAVLSDDDAREYEKRYQLERTAALSPVDPVFELQAKQDYFVQGVEKKLILKLNACRGSKWSLPFKNTDYTIQDFEFTAFCDANNNWGTFAFSE